MNPRCRPSGSWAPPSTVFGPVWTLLYLLMGIAAWLVWRERERVIALEPYGKGLLGTTLRYPYEVRSAEDYFCDLPELTIAPDMLTLAEHILDRKAGEFNPATFRDRYEEALLAHLKAKQAGVPERKQMFAAPQRVVNLMEALRRSVAADTKGAAPRKGAPAVPARKRA